MNTTTIPTAEVLHKAAGADAPETEQGRTMTNHRLRELVREEDGGAVLLVWLVFACAAPFVALLIRSLVVMESNQ